MEPLPELLTPSEVADFLRVTTATVYRMADDGRLPSLKFGRGRRSTLRFRRDAVESLAAQGKAEAS